MDSVDIIKVCARRWYVMLPILIGAAGVSHQLVQAQQQSYTAYASYGWVQPGLTSQDDVEKNPLGTTGDTLIGAALEAQLNSREAQADLGSASTRGWGPGEPANKRSYDVRIPQFETTYEVRTWGEDEQEVRDVVERVIDAAPGIAEDLQIRANVPPEQRYEPFVLAPTQVEALPSSGWVKLVVAVMGVGLLMGAAWSVVVDRSMRWRRTRRTAAARPGAARTAAAPPPPGSDEPRGRPHQGTGRQRRDEQGRDEQGGDEQGGDDAPDHEPVADATRTGAVGGRPSPPR